MFEILKNKSFQEEKKKIAPVNYTAEVVYIDQIIPKSTWLNQELIFFIIFFVARFERNLILRINVKKKQKKESQRNYCA